MKQLRALDWEAVAGIAAAATALVLHLLHVAEEGVLLAVALVLLALILLRDLRRESRDEDESAAVAQIGRSLEQLRLAVAEPEIVLIGPRDLRRESERFAIEARGDMLWFNVCLSMFQTQALFDVLLRPALENPRVRSIQFVLDPSEQERWQTSLLPKARASNGAAKLQEPRWVSLEESISFILAGNSRDEQEAHVSFWGEPFMARQQGQQLPRYIIRVLPRCELISRLIELERSYRPAS